MRIIIMGCGRTGSLLARMLADADHDVAVIDWDESAFSRLPEDFPGQTVRGNAMDQDILREAGIESADAFVSATSGDNRNIMAAEIAQTVFNVPRVVSRIKDPSRAKLYHQLGILVDCRTLEGTDLLMEIVDKELQHTA